MSPEITIQVASRPTENERKLGLVPPPDRLHYLPWGTRSLKLAISGTYKGELIIAPARRAAQAGQIWGLASGPAGEEMRISWGGGWEEGFRLEHEPGSLIYAFFNLTHQGQAAESYPIELVARDPKENELGRASILLQRPLLPDARLVPSWRQEAPGLHELLLAPSLEHKAAQVPFYLSRWWPEAWVSYADPAQAGAPPQIRLACQRDSGQGFSQVDVWAAPAGGGNEQQLATIGGDLQFPLVDLHHISADLYRLAGHWALRIWFFWLDKDIPGRLRQAGMDPAALSAAEQAVLARWATEQELPDAERVDLVFDPALNLRYLCTDLHWHELWAPYQGNLPLRISIAGERMRDVVLRGAQGLYVVAAGRALSYIPRPDRGFDPSQEVIERLNDPSRAEKGAGSMAHKHTPFFHGVEFDAELTSSDVLKG